MKYRSIIILQALLILTAFVACNREDTNLGTQIKQTVKFSVDSELNVSTRGTTLDNTAPIQANGFYVSTENTNDGQISDIGNVRYNGATYNSPAITWIESDELNFYAYYPATVTDVFSVAASDTIPDIHYDMPQEVVNHIDIVAAKTNSAYTNLSVPLAFSHIMSGLRFLLIDATTTNAYKLSISSISIHGLTTQAIYSVKTATWDSADPTTSQEAKSTIVHFETERELKTYADYPTDKTTAFSIMKSDNEAMFVPRQNEADLSDLVIFISFDITTADRTQSSVIKITGDKLITSKQTLAGLIASVESGEMLEMTLQYNDFNKVFVINGEMQDWANASIWFPDYE